MRVQCPACDLVIDTTLFVPEAVPGSEVTCPQCKKVLRLPGPLPAAQAKAPEPQKRPGWETWEVPGMRLYDLLVSFLTAAAIVGVPVSFTLDEVAARPIFLAGAVAVFIQCGIYWAVRDLRRR
jgi:hypothetical protein